MEKQTLLDKMKYGSFYLGLVIELAVVILDKSDWQNIYESQLFRLTFLLFAAVILCTRYTLREYLVLAAAGGIAFLSWRISGRDELLRFLAFAAACKDIPLRQMMRTVFFVTLAGCLSLVALSVTGIFGIASITEDFGRGMVQTRYCLGMGHPNALHCMFLMLLLLGLYLYLDRIAWWGWLLLFAANTGAYLLTDSRIGTLIGFGALALAVWMRFWPGMWKKRWVYSTGSLAVFAMAGGSAWMTEHYSHELDRLWNMRLWTVIASAHANASNWTWFASGENSSYFDMGFVRLFYWYGIVPGLLIVFILICMCWNAGKKADYAALLLIISCAAYTVAEAHLVSVYIGRNYLLMLLGGTWSAMLAGKKGQARAERPFTCYRLLKTVETR